jgi:hypothetical protein
MHIDLKEDNKDFAIREASKMDCSVSDYVNSLLTAVRESEYVREFKIQLVSKENPSKKICKTIKMRRHSRTDRYDPLS